MNQRSPARSGKVKGKSLLKKDIKNENKRRQETSTTMAAM
jgi:hypothetical protein